MIRRERISRPQLSKATFQKSIKYKTFFIFIFRLKIGAKNSKMEVTDLKRQENAEIIIEDKILKNIVKAGGLIANCQACIDVYKTGSFKTGVPEPTFQTEITENVEQLKEELTSSLSKMIQQLGTVNTQIGTECSKLSNVVDRVPPGRIFKETALKNSDVKVYPFLRSLLTRKRSKSERSKLIVRTSGSFCKRRQSERIVEVDPKDEHIRILCNSVNILCGNISTLITHCFLPTTDTLSNRKVITLFENSWARVFSFEASLYAYEHKTYITKANTIIPKGMAYPTKNDIFCLMNRLTDIFGSIIKVGTIHKSGATETFDKQYTLIQNLTECNRYIRVLLPVLHETFISPDRDSTEGA